MIKLFGINYWLTNSLLLAYLLVVISCKVIDHEKVLPRYMEAKDVLLKHKETLAKFGSSDGLVLLTVDRESFGEIAKKIEDPEMKIINALWVDDLLFSQGAALTIYKNGSINFIVKRSKNREEQIIYDPAGIEMFQTDETSFDLLGNDWYLRIDRFKD